VKAKRDDLVCHEPTMVARETGVRRRVDAGGPEKSPAFEAAAARSAPVALVVLDTLRERVVYANRRAEALLGLSRGELANIGLGACLAWEADARGLPAPGALRAALASAALGKEACCELGLLRHGSARRVLARFEPTFGAGPFVSGVLEEPPGAPASAAAGPESHDSAVRLNLAPGSTRQGFWDWDIGSGRVFLSEPWLEQLGYAAGELPGHVECYKALIHPEDVPQAEAVFESRLLGRSPIEYAELRLKDRSGHYRRFAQRGRVVARAADGSALRMIGTDTDITELTAADEGLQQTQAERARSQRLASVGMLAAGVAHEINNPLAYILNNLDFALNLLPRSAATQPPGHAAGLDPEAIDALKEAREGALRVREIVKGLRTFSRPSTSQWPLLDVHEVIESSLNLARGQILARAKLSVSWSATLLVRADRERLGQVFLNLLVNACEAIEPGRAPSNGIGIVTRDVIVRDAITREEREMVEVIVKDTGIGISPGQLEHIFDLFYTTKPVGAGTGLGLSICHDLVEALGGTMHVTSQVGRGTEFCVRLPGAGSEPGAHYHTPPEPSDEKHDDQKVWQRAQRLLVVDDDPLVARSVRRLLGGARHVTLAHDGPSALEELRKNRYDVVLCDMVMPEMDGVSLLEAVRAERPAAARRFVFMTGSLFDCESRKRLLAVSAPCVAKPLDLGELTQALAQVLDARVPTNGSSARLGPD
jgi:signal transduction histidine kinase/ActR/RegA family two-component response regulator